MPCSALLCSTLCFLLLRNGGAPASLQLQRTRHTRGMQKQRERRLMRCSVCERSLAVREGELHCAATLLSCSFQAVAPFTSMDDRVAVDEATEATISDAR